MRYSTLWLTLAICGLSHAVEGGRELSQADAARAKELYAKAVALGREGKFEEAQVPVREILELRTREQGPDHFETADLRREIETLKKLATLPEESRAEYRKTYVLSDEMGELWKKGRYAEALRSAEAILEIYRRLLGSKAHYVAFAANHCGQLLHFMGRHAEAGTHFRQALAIARESMGESHPNTATLCGNLALCLEKQGKFVEARRLQEAALASTLRVRGEWHPATAVAYNNLAQRLNREARHEESEQLYRKVVKILRDVEKEPGDRLATACNNLGYSLQQQARYAEAEPLFQEALAIRHKISGRDHPDTALVLTNLAANREAQGDIAAAEILHRDTLRIFRVSPGVNHLQTAWAMNNLAVNLDRQGNSGEAESLLLQALATVERLPSDQREPVAKMSNNLASCLQRQDRAADAVAILNRALGVLRDALGTDHPEVAVTLNNLAATLDVQRKYREAERYLREALAILQRRQGAAHTDTALGRANLGVNLYHQGRYEDAEQLFKEALATQRRVLGEGHPHTAWTYKLLVLNCCARGEYAQAAGLASAAARSFEIAHRRISFAGLDRASRMSESSPFPGLAVVAARQGKPDAAWNALEQNLARGLWDDLAARPLTAEERGRERALVGTLNRLDRLITERLAEGKSAPEELSLEEIRKLRDTAQMEFVRFQTEMAARYGVAMGEVHDLRRVQAQIPEDAALLAWVDLDDQAQRVDPRGDHWACLVRHRGAPIWQRLSGTGPHGAWTEDDDRLTTQTRQACASRPTSPVPREQDLIRRLRLQRFAPLERHLNATDNLPAVRHLIVLPSHRMAGLPLEVLAERLTVSYSSSATLFTWLREKRHANGRRAGSASLLAVGDPALSPIQEKQGSFRRLPGTRQEVLGIARVFSRTQLLLGAEASERNMDQLAASDGLGTFGYLHFATHGVLDDQHPMHSSLLLAQTEDHAPPHGQRQRVQGSQGRLTAMQILRSWKLDADLVTLSACKSGLGQYAGGEGYLGFSQALFLAGARSMVVSLWPVDDAATALLMTRFYENLLGTPDGAITPKSRAVALAEAKRWLRKLGPDEVRQLTRDLTTSGTRGRIVPSKSGVAPTVSPTYDHPYYWSGFILIGDPG